MVKRYWHMLLRALGLRARYTRLNRDDRRWTIRQSNGWTHVVLYNRNLNRSFVASLLDCPLDTYKRKLLRDLLHEGQRQYLLALDAQVVKDQHFKRFAYHQRGPNDRLH